MRAVIYFVNGTDLVVEGAAAHVVSYLSSGWAAVDLENGGKAHVNGGNVLYVEEQLEERNRVLAEIDRG